MKETDKPYLNLSLFVIAMLVLSAYAFYPGYFSKLNNPLPWAMHIHFVLMMVWMGMLIAQPMLIRKKKYRLHRKIGKWSFMVVPMVLISSFLMIRYAYFRDLDQLQANATAGISQMDTEEIVHQARIYIALPFYYFFGFIIFYPLAIINKSNTTAHARYMMATALCLIGPVVDRAFYYGLTALKLSVDFMIEGVAFILINLILASLLYVDFKKGNNKKPLLIALGIFVTGQAGYLFFRDSWLWQSFVGLVL